MPVPDEIESRYYASQGFDPAHAREVRSHYLSFVEGKQLLLELGCGRGEFLQLAAPSVGRVLGVDVDPDMVKQAGDAGFEAVQADVLDYLAITDERPDAVFLAHLIEHLPVDAAFEVLQRVAALVPPGGVVIVVTPNPACLANLTNDFWSDPTHVRLYTVDLLRFLLDQTGFDVVDAGGNPLDVPGPPPELLASASTEPWGAADVEVAPMAPMTYDESFQLETVLDELSRLRTAVESMAHWIREHDARLTEVRHFAEATAARHDDTLRHLYGPNEIYAVGARRP
jgi:SAM-dependent methyltransferase